MLSCQQYIATVKPSVKEIDAGALHANLDQFDLIVDVREPDETAQGVIPNAICLPRGVLETQLERLRPAGVTTPVTEWLPKQNVLLYCRSGGRSVLAAASLSAMGLHKVYSLSGGIADWYDKGYATAS